MVVVADWAAEDWVVVEDSAVVDSDSEVVDWGVEGSAAAVVGSVAVDSAAVEDSAAEGSAAEGSVAEDSVVVVDWGVEGSAVALGANLPPRSFAQFRSAECRIVVHHTGQTSIRLYVFYHRC